MKAKQNKMYKQDAEKHVIGAAVRLWGFLDLHRITLRLQSTHFKSKNGFRVLPNRYNPDALLATDFFIITIQ